MTETITKLDDETLEIVTPRPVTRRITKTELLAQKERTEDLLKEFD